MLRGYPGVRRWAETDDVFQSAVLRLLRAMREVRPSNTREFFGLAATQVRRELLDLARHYYGKQGLGANHASWPGAGRSEASLATPRTAGPTPAGWPSSRTSTSRSSGSRPREREVVVLRVYQGLTEAEIAPVLGVTTQSVQNYWRPRRS